MIEILDRAGPSVPLSGGFFMYGMEVLPKEPEPDLPEFAFTPVEQRERWFARSLWLPQPKPRAIRIIERTGPAMPWPKPKRTKPADAGGADPVWGTAFALKFSKEPEYEMVVPKGTVNPWTPLNDKVAEIAWIDATCTKEIATTLQTFRANSVPAFALNYNPRNDETVRQLKADAGEALPAFFRLPDRVYTDEATGQEMTEERYGDLNYIAAMERRIEWERWRSQNGPNARAFFNVDRNGSVGIEVASRLRDPDLLTRMRQRMKQLWLDAHTGAPTPEEIAFRTAQVTGNSVESRMTYNQRLRWEQAKRTDDEDHDPLRVSLAADPRPKPGRWQYAYGDHRNCTWSDDADDYVSHRWCTQDGDELFAMDLAVWNKQREDLNEVEYAGPHGQLGVDEDAVED